MQQIASLAILAAMTVGTLVIAGLQLWNKQYGLAAMFAGYTVTNCGSMYLMWGVIHG